MGLYQIFKAFTMAVPSMIERLALNFKVIRLMKLISKISMLGYKLFIVELQLIEARETIRLIETSANVMIANDPIMIAVEMMFQKKVNSIIQIIIVEIF